MTTPSLRPQGSWTRSEGPLRALAGRGGRALLGALLALASLASTAGAQDTPRWARVLEAHARDGRVDYAALAADAPRRADLEAYVASLAAMPEEAPIGAFIDAYNALVVAAIVRRLPLASVRDVPGFFDRETHRVAGRARTLDAIEHEILRPRFVDARVHAALVCGARSCPPLSALPFAGRDATAALDEAVRAFLASGRAARVEREGLAVNAIFEWFRADFERDAGSVAAWLGARDPRLGAAARRRVRTLPYDWALNTP